MKAKDLIGKLAIRTKPVVVNDGGVKDYSYTTTPIHITNVTDNHIVYDLEGTKEESIYGKNTYILNSIWLDDNWEDYENLINPKKNKRKTRIDKEDIDKILSETKIKVHKYGNKTTVLEAGLPNGFEIVVSYSSDNSNNYNSTTGEKVCMDKLISKIFELERYRLQSELSKKTIIEKINLTSEGLFISKKVEEEII